MAQRSPAPRRRLTARALAERVAVEADPFSFNFAEYARAVQRIAPEASSELRAEAFAELPAELQRVAHAALRAEIESER